MAKNEEHNNALIKIIGAVGVVLLLIFLAFKKFGGE